MTQEVESASEKRGGVGSGSVEEMERRELWDGGGSVDRGRVEDGGAGNVRNIEESQEGGRWYCRLFYSTFVGLVTILTTTI